MAGDDGNDDWYGDDMYAYDDAYMYYEDVSFEGYEPTTIDPGYWMIFATAMVCMFMIAVLILMVWCTQKKRKRQEEKWRNDALAAEEGKAQDEKASVGTTSTEAESDSDSIATEIEDDTDSVTSTTVPVIDTLYSCGAQELSSPMALRRSYSRRLRGGDKHIKDYFMSGEMETEILYTCGVQELTSPFALRRVQSSRFPGTDYFTQSKERCMPEEIETDFVIHVDDDDSSVDLNRWPSLRTTKLDCIDSEYHLEEEPKGASPDGLMRSEDMVPYCQMGESAVSGTSETMVMQDSVGKGKGKRFKPKRLAKAFGWKKKKAINAKHSVHQSEGERESREGDHEVFYQLNDEIDGILQIETIIKKDSAIVSRPLVFHPLDDDSTTAAISGNEEVPTAVVEGGVHQGMQSDLTKTENVESTSTPTNNGKFVDGALSKPKQESKPRRRRRCRPFCRKIRQVAEYENEMKKILKLAIPYTLSALVECISDILEVAVIGNLLGTRALSAYISVDFALSITTLWIEGPLDCLSIMCSQAIGMGEKKLAGQYLQIAVVVTQILYLPQMVLWLYCIDDFILWLGFDEETAQIGYDYAIVLLASDVFGIMHDGLHYFLEVCDYEGFSAIISILQEVIAFVAVLSVALTSSPSLQMIGIIHFALDVVFFIICLIIINCNGWFEDYWTGITGSFAFENFQAVKHLFRTSLPLSAAHVLSGGEGEILFVLASLLGPAEMVAWGIFGTIWEGIETATTAIADAGEVRCAYLLGADKPMRAKHSAQKTMLLGFMEGLVVVAFLAASGQYLTQWITNDQTLQGLLGDLFPYICVGMLSDMVSSVSFALLCAQGRISLATTVYVVGSWLLTLPLAFVSSYVLNLNLEGLAASVVVGSSLSGMISTFLLLDSDWYHLSHAAAAAQQRNNAELV